jgi:hypothetical protein
MKQKKLHRKSSDDTTTASSPMSNSLTSGGGLTGGHNGDYATVVGSDDDCDDDDDDDNAVNDDMDENSVVSASVGGCHMTGKSVSGQRHLTACGNGLFSMVVGQHVTPYDNEARSRRVVGAGVNLQTPINRNQYYSSSPTTLSMERDVSMLQRDMMIVSAASTMPVGSDSDIESC